MGIAAQKARQPRTHSVGDVLAYFVNNGVEGKREPLGSIVQQDQGDHVLSSVEPPSLEAERTQALSQGLGRLPHDSESSHAPREGNQRG
jgi:hypothetical protein